MTYEITKWDHRFIEIAQVVASWSPDRSTKVGAVIVDNDNNIISTGYNGFPRGMDYTEDWMHDRPVKYELTEHGERNAIFAAARRGVSLKGAKMYMNADPMPCSDCSRAIVQSGISYVIGPSIPFPGKGRGTHYDAAGMNSRILEDCGVKVITIEEDR